MLLLRCSLLLAHSLARPLFLFAAAGRRLCVAIRPYRVPQNTHAMWLDLPWATSTRFIVRIHSRVKINWKRESTTAATHRERRKKERRVLPCCVLLSFCWRCCRFVGKLLYSLSMAARCLLSAGFLRISNESKTQPGAGDLCCKYFREYFVRALLLFIVPMFKSFGCECWGRKPQAIVTPREIQTSKIRRFVSAKGTQKVHLFKTHNFGEIHDRFWLVANDIYWYNIGHF